MLTIDAHTIMATAHSPVISDLASWSSEATDPTRIELATSERTTAALRSYADVEVPFHRLNARYWH